MDKNNNRKLPNIPLDNYEQKPVQNNRPKNNFNSDEMLQKIKNTNQQKKSNKNLIRNSSIVIAALLLLSGGGYMIYKALPQNQKIENTTKIDDKVTNLASENDLGVTPVELPDWARKPYFELTDDDKKNIKKFQDDNFIGYATDPYPSEEAGFTSDKSKAYDSDGIPNIYYNSITKESAKEQMATILNRLINPIFGGWISYQYPNIWGQGMQAERVHNLLADITTPEYFDSLIKENGNKPPILIDYNNNDYNGALTGIENFKDLSENSVQKVYQARFIGTIRENTGEVTYEENDKIIINVIIDYKTSDNKIFTSKKLHLILKNIDGLLKIDGGELNEI